MQIEFEFIHNLYKLFIVKKKKILALISSFPCSPRAAAIKSYSESSTARKSIRFKISRNCSSFRTPLRRYQISQTSLTKVESVTLPIVREIRVIIIIPHTHILRSATFSFISSSRYFLPKGRWVIIVNKIELRGELSNLYSGKDERVNFAK